MRHDVAPALSLFCGRQESAEEMHSKDPEKVKD